MITCATISEFKKAREELGSPVGFVPTMGFLHNGHLSLVRRARNENAGVVVSIFVNPTQFGPNEDFNRYPRDLKRDLGMLASEGVDLVFTPGPEEIYPPGFATFVEVQGISDRLEGAYRPGHFRGVATVVAKLLNIVAADRAYFGQKDAQQVAVIKRMVADLHLGCEIVVCPTVRERDGLAMSSRNIYLSPEEREAALAIYRSLVAGYMLWQSGESNATRIRDEVLKELLSGLPASPPSDPQRLTVDYVAVVDSENFDDIDDTNDIEGAGKPAILLIAAKAGRTRLIDNVVLEHSQQGLGEKVSIL